MNRLFLALALGFILAVANSANADWMAIGDYTGCPRKHVKDTYRKEGPFTTKEACQARAEEARVASKMSCAKFTCSEVNSENTNSSSEPAEGHQMDEHITNAIVAGVNGDISAGDAASIAAMGFVGNAILAPSKKTKSNDNSAEVEEQKSKEESKNRLLGEMKDVEGSGDLQLMGDESSKSFMPVHHKRPKRNPPKAVIKKPVPKLEPAQAPLIAQADVPAPPANANAARPAAANVDSFGRGLREGLDCISQNAGNACVGVTADQMDNCVADYRRGHEQGTRASQMRIDQAFRNGLEDRRLNRQTPQDVAGGCSMQIQNAYRSGLAGAIRP